MGEEDAAAQHWGALPLRRAYTENKDHQENYYIYTHRSKEARIWSASLSLYLTSFTRSRSNKWLSLFAKFRHNVGLIQVSLVCACVYVSLGRLASGQTFIIPPTKVVRGFIINDANNALLDDDGAFRCWAPRAQQRTERRREFGQRYIINGVH